MEGIYEEKNGENNSCHVMIYLWKRRIAMAANTEADEKIRRIADI